MTQELESLRIKLGSLDNEIVRILNERASISKEVGEAKKCIDQTQTNHETYNPTQEKKVYERIINLNNGPITNDALKAIYREIMSASISLQKEDTKVCFLGPRGSFTNQVFEQVMNKSCSYGVVPFENSATGVVIETLDAFIDYPKVCIRAEIHLEAFNQCSKWLKIYYPKCELIVVNSTSKAAEIASSEMYSAALCSSLASKIYDVPILNEKINDFKGLNFDKPSGDDRTLLSFTLDHRKPGALCNALEAFKSANINLTKIDTRPHPSKLEPWHYIFFVEFVGHYTDDGPSQVIKEINEFCLNVRVLGSYPSRPS